MKKLRIIPFLIFTFFLSKAQNYDASIKFYIDNVSGTVEGTLEGFEADINFNPANPDDSKIEASVDVSTIETGINLRDKHLKEKNFFRAEKYPVIRMESVDITRMDEGTFTGTFRLTIKGTTKIIEFPFKYSKLGNTEQFRGEFKIDRVDFDVGDNAVLFGEEVRVELDVKVIK